MYFLKTDELKTLAQGFFFGVYEKTQGEKNSNSRKMDPKLKDFSLKTQEIGNFKVNCRQNL